MLVTPPYCGLGGTTQPGGACNKSFLGHSAVCGRVVGAGDANSCVEVEQSTESTSRFEVVVAGVCRLGAESDPA